MATTARIALHDRVRLRNEVQGTPAGATGAVVQVFENGLYGVELDDLELTDHADGIVDANEDDLEFLAHLQGA